MPTLDVADEKTRDEYANEGEALINAFVDRLNMPHIVEQMSKLGDYTKETEELYPWVPSRYNRH